MNVAIKMFWMSGHGDWAEEEGAQPGGTNIWLHPKRKPMFIMALTLEQKQKLIEWLKTE